MPWPEFEPWTSHLAVQHATAERETEAERDCHRFSGIFHSFIHSGYFYSALSSPLLLRSAPDTARILCRGFTLKRHRQQRVKDLLKVPTWWLDRDLNPRLSGREASTLPKRHHIPLYRSLYSATQKQQRSQLASE